MHTQDHITETVVSVIAEQMMIDTDEITLNDRLVEDIGMDSLDLVEATMALEEKLDIEIFDEDADKWKIVEDIVTYLSEQEGVVRG